MMEQGRICAILLAAGSGSRMNIAKTKQTVDLKGKSVLLHSLTAFEKCGDITDIILVVRADERDFALSETSKISKLRRIVVGGSTRMESAKNGFSAIDFPVSYVAIHDVARCLISPEAISKISSDARACGAASASSVVVDTVKRVDERGFVIKTENREELRLAGTPQIFERELYAKALSQIDCHNSDITDDNMLMEKIGVPVFMTDIGRFNIKITHAEDLLFAEYLLENKNG